MPLTFRHALPALVAAATLAAPAAAQEIDLSYTWQAGDTLTYAMTSESSQAQTGMANQSTSANSQQVLAIEVLSVDAEGVSTIRQTTKSMKVNVTKPSGVELSYDSEAESNASAAADPMIASLAALDGSEFTIVLGPDGSVIDIPDYDAWREGANAGDGAKPFLSAAPPKDALMKNIEGAYKTLAGKTIAQGESWTTEMRNEFAPGASMTFSFENTVAAIATRSGDKQADIETTGTIDLQPPAGSPMEIKLAEQEITGNSVFSSEKGAVVSSQGAVHMVMTVGPPGAGAMMTMTMDQKSTLKLLTFERGG